MRISWIFIVFFLCVITKCHDSELLCDHFENETNQQHQLISDFVTHTRMFEFKPANLVDFKIHIDYSHLTTSTVNHWGKIYIQKYLVPQAVDFITQRLSVLKRTSKLVLPSYVRKCGNEINIPYDHKNSGIDADFILYIGGIDEPNSKIFVKAGPCLFDQGNGNRPIAGRLEFNTVNLDRSWEMAKKYKAMIIHNLIHTLVFSKTLFPYFVDKTGKNLRLDQVIQKVETPVMGKQLNFIVTPKVKELAAKHFGCPSLPGLPLDPRSKSGGHWYKPVVYPGVMVGKGSDHFGMLTEFTLALFEDSGWFFPKKQYFEPMIWGKDKGCDFVFQGCKKEPLFPEFCAAEGENGCSFGKHAIGKCTKLPIMDDCAVFESKEPCNSEHVVKSIEFGYYYGVNSKCASISKLSVWYHNGDPDFKVNCYSGVCSEDGKTVEIRVGENSVKCEREGQRLTPKNFKGQIICPDPAEYCYDFTKKCDDSCFYNGFCDSERHKCYCHLGYEGKNCKKQIKPVFRINFLYNLMKNGFVNDKRWKYLKRRLFYGGK